MQKGGTSDIPHVSFSDHWIRKDPGPPRDPDDARTFVDSPDPIRLVALQQEDRGSQFLEARTTDTPLDRLETAIAYFTFYEQFQGVPAYMRTTIDEV
jgi:hypothetical protein